jgi:hypothetical protein
VGSIPINTWLCYDLFIKQVQDAMDLPQEINYGFRDLCHQNKVSHGGKIKLVEFVWLVTLRTTHSINCLSIFGVDGRVANRTCVQLMYSSKLYDAHMQQ